MSVAEGHTERSNVLSAIFGPLTGEFQIDSRFFFIYLMCVSLTLTRCRGHDLVLVVFVAILSLTAVPN